MSLVKGKLTIVVAAIMTRLRERGNEHQHKDEKLSSLVDWWLGWPSLDYALQKVS